jgi:hypothetical protein
MNKFSVTYGLQRVRYCCGGKEISFSFSECEFAALCTQMQRTYALISFVVCSDLKKILLILKNSPFTKDFSST